MQSKDYFFLDSNLYFMQFETFSIDKYILVFVEKGTAHITLERNEYVLNANRMLLLRPNLNMKLLKASEDFRVSVLGFPRNMLHEYTQRVEPSFFLLIYTRIIWPLSDKNRPHIDSFKKLFRFAVEHEGTAYNRELILTLVSGFVFGLYALNSNIHRTERVADSSRARELFRKFMDLLHRNYTEQHEVQFYAGELCITAKYLTQITKRIIGATPKQLIDERLIHEASALLSNNNSSIQEISSRLGFVDQSYFGRFFKRMMHVSPQQYRLRPNGTGRNFV